MIRVIKTNAYEIYKAIQGKKLVVFGSGRVLTIRFERFSNIHFEEYVDYIVDNNEKLWNTNKTVMGKELPIKSPEYMRNHIDRNTVMLIMVNDYKPIVRQLSTYTEMKGVKVFRYPDIYHRHIDMWDRIIQRMPINKHAIILQGEGDNRENALALFEYMQENRLLGRYKVIWYCSHPEWFKNTRNVIHLHRDTMTVPSSLINIWRYKYYSQKAQFIMYENMFIFKANVLQKAFYLKHGTFMLKDVKGKIMIPEEVDFAICTSDNYVDLACEQEAITKDRLVICGSPRLDFLFKNKNVLKTLGIYEKEKKYILWLPTLRQTKDGMRNDVKKIAPYGIPLMKSEADFERVDAYLGSVDCKLIIKPHPHQDLSVYKVGGYQNIIFLPQQELDRNDFTIHSLMGETHGMISDYSSVAFDYMLLDRPMAYTIDDLDDYKIGFSVPNPLYYMPGEKLETCDDMIKYLGHVSKGEDPMKSDRHEIRDFIHKYQDDKNAERFLEKMGMI